MQTTERNVRLFRNGSNQAIRIPREFELEGKEATIRKEGNKLIIEALKKQSLVEWLDSLETIPETSAEIFPKIDDNDLLPLDDIDL
jgi:antitoxin VapB